MKGVNQHSEGEGKRGLSKDKKTWKARVDRYNEGCDIEENTRSDGGKECVGQSKIAMRQR